MSTMTAALLRAPRQPFRLESVPVPRPRDDEVLVRIAAVGVCGGDLHRLDGGIEVRPLPSVIGHQVAGEVYATGPLVPREIAEGMRVAVLPFDRCGACRNCLSGRDNLCLRAEQRWSLVEGYYGGYAEYVAVPHRCLLEVPPSIPLTEAASLTDAIATPYHAVRLAGIRVGDVVVVFGIGDLGSAIVQLAALEGGIVVAIDVHEEKLRLAQDLGARYAVDAREQDPVAAVLELTGGAGAQVAFEAAGLAATTLQAGQAAARGGTVVLVGATDGDVAGFSTAPYGPGGFSIRREITMLGAWAMTTGDVRSVIELRERGLVDVTRAQTVLPLGGINDAFARKAAGELTRVVLVPGR